jgi:hypothetical protein
MAKRALGGDIDNHQLIISSYYPELQDYETRMRYFRQMNERNKPLLLKYWSGALQRLFSEVRNRACLKMADIHRVFIVDSYQVASLPKIITSLALDKEFMVLENLDLDIEKRLVNLRAEVPKPKSNGVVDTLVNMFFNRLPPVEQFEESPISPEHFIVHTKTLEKKLYRYLDRECHLLKKQAFNEQNFVSKAELQEFFEGEGEHHYDALIMMIALQERKIIHPEKRKDAFGRVIKGYTMIDPESSDYKIHSAQYKISQSIAYIEGRIEEFQNKTKNLHNQILHHFKMMNKEAAKALGKDKLKIEKQIVFLINKKSILEDSLSSLKDGLSSNLTEECWKICKDLQEKHMLEVEDFKDTVMNNHELKEKNAELDQMLKDQNEEEDKEIEAELKRIEAEVNLEQMMSKPSPNKKMDSESARKPGYSNPLIAGVGPQNNAGEKFESLFGNNFGITNSFTTANTSTADVVDPLGRFQTGTIVNKHNPFNVLNTTSTNPFDSNRKSREEAQQRSSNPFLDFA